MAEFTPKRNLEKPNGGDFYDVGVFNNNADKLDDAVPDARTINGKSLTANVTLTAADVGAAATAHPHGAGDITSGTLPPDRGGTGQPSLQAARNAMGLGNTTGALPVANGGTGNTTGLAATATALATARTIAISGGATGTATGFNGTANITIPVTALNMDNANAGTLPVVRGGTGATDAAGARTNLGAAASSHNHDAGNITSGTGATGTATSFNGTANITVPITQLNGSYVTAGTVPAANGGTGNTSLQATRNAMGLGNTTGALPIANGGTGATSAAAALTNLGIRCQTGDPGAGSALTTGSLLFVYE